MSTYLITGGGRGIGLGYVRELAKRAGASKVIAVTRSKPTQGLNDVIAQSAGKVVNVLCDVSSQESVDGGVEKISAALGGAGLDVLVNVVGGQNYVKNGVASMTNEDLVEIMNLNVGTAHRMTVAMLPLLRKGKDKKVINISTTVGSISMARGFSLAPVPSYKITKAALNMLTTQYAIEHEKEGFTFAVLSPGWVKTDMTPPFADLDMDVAAPAGVDQIEQAGPHSNGKFLNILVPGYEDAPFPNYYNGGNPPW